MLNACMVMLASAATKAAGLADEGYDMTAFETEVAGVSGRLQQVSLLRAAAAQQALPDLSDLEALTASLTPPALSLPPAETPSSQGSTLEQRRQQAHQNLGSYALLPEAASFKAACSWAQQACGDDDLPLLLRLRGIEQFLFSRVAAGITAGLLSVTQVGELAALVDTYSGLLRKLLSTPAGRAYMSVELFSRELLVVWAAYCLMDASARHHHPDRMAGYEVSLHWTDLRHLVLSDRAAVDAALGINDYLKANDCGAGLELFSLRDEGRATFQFAQQFAARSTQHQQLLKAEQQDAAERVEAHWQRVQQKKRQVADLRKQLSELQSDLQSKKWRLAAATRERDAIASDERQEWSKYGYWFDTDVYAAAKSKVSSCQSAVSSVESSISSVERELKEAERAPPPVIQPLPQKQDKAQQWLFFLHMPSIFRHLSRASFLAQQMLLPHQLSGTAHSALCVKGLSTSLAQHYNSYQSCSYHSPSQHRRGEDGKVEFRSRRSPPDTKDIGPHHIDSFTSRSDGVWYPDSLPPSLGWAGAGSPADQPQLSGNYHDPFVPISKQGKCGCEGLSFALGCACLSCSSSAAHGFTPLGAGCTPY
jgi:hypothetical protein